MLDEISLEELQTKAESMQQRLAEVQAALAAKRAQAHAQLLDELRQAIRDGLDPVLVEAALKQKKEQASRPMALKTDPNLIYSRGKMPQWLKDAITGAGLNPTVAADREKFRAEHMVAVA